MLHHLLHPLSALWRERIDLFWPIWIAITAMGVMLVIWVVPEKKKIPPDSIPFRPHDGSRGAILAVIFLSVFLAFYIAGSLVWEDFTYYDNSHYTNGTLAGHNIPLQIWPEGGRFWPLGDQEFNLLRHVTHSITGYHSLRIFQLLLMSGILLVLDETLSVKKRVALIALALITPSILISFYGLEYPEVNVLFGLVCLAWFIKRFERTQSIVWAVGAVISSQFMLYYKETAFLLLLGFAGGRLLLRCWKGNYAGWDFKRLRDPESRLDLCLALLGVLFLLYYFAAMFPNFHTRYADKFRVPLKDVLASYLKLDFLVWVFVVVVLARVFLILRRKVVPALLWDGLALGGTGCFAAYLILGMYGGYYLAPVDLIACLYLGRLAFLSIDKMSRGTRLCVLALLPFILLQDLSFSAFRMYEAKNVIHAKAELGRVIEARYASSPQNVKRLFFPFASPYDVLEFASYLNYLGVPVEQSPTGSVAIGNVMLVGKEILHDGPCGYRTFVCHPGNTPDRGDLVVVLPDDFTSTDELNSYLQEGAEPLISYHPRPPIPRWLQSYVNRLHVVSPIFAHDQLPDFWLNALVTVWK
jgi:hypothetical protein